MRGTTYYVVRHAERDPGEDSPLNAEGFERAERLADALEEAGVDEIIATGFLRTQQTGEPLADRSGAPIVVAPVDTFEAFLDPEAWAQFATDVADWQLEREVPGATYLMIGHSSSYNTTLLEKLGATAEGPLAERYQDFVVLIREQDGTTKLSALQYGGTSSLDP